MKLNFRQYASHSNPPPPIIILHGLLGSCDNWQPIATRLQDKFTVYTLDLRNHGHSPHSTNMTYPLMATDIATFLHDHHIETASILGHSMGGKVAMYFAVMYPQKVHALMVIDVAPKPYPATHRPIFEALMALPLDRLTSRYSCDQLLSKSIPSSITRQFLLKNLTRTKTGHFRWKANLNALLGNYDHLRAGLLDHCHFDGNTRFVRGDRSHYILDSDIPKIKHHFPNATVDTIANAGHWIHVDQRDHFIDYVITTLSRSGYR